MNRFDLENEKLKPGFAIPQNYFDGLEDKVFAKLDHEQKVVPIFPKRKVIWYMAAAILVLAFIIPIYTTFRTHQPTDDASLENYIAYQSNVSQYDLIALLAPEDIENLKIDLPVEDETIEDILSSNNNLEEIIIE